MRERVQIAVFETVSRKSFFMLEIGYLSNMCTLYTHTFSVSFRNDW